MRSSPRACHSTCCSELVELTGCKMEVRHQRDDAPLPSPPGMPSLWCRTSIISGWSDAAPHLMRAPKRRSATESMINCGGHPRHQRDDRACLIHLACHLFSAALKRRSTLSDPFGMSSLWLRPPVPALKRRCDPALIYRACHHLFGCAGPHPTTIQPGASREAVSPRLPPHLPLARSSSWWWWWRRW